MSNRPTPALLAPGELVLRDGAPYSQRFGDVYKNRHGALAEARHVFVAGSGAPHAWLAQRSWTVLELGFGVGANFLATLECWRAQRGGCRRLHYVSCEKHPLPRESLAQALAAIGADAALAQALLAQWPPPMRGLYRLEFDRGDVQLTLALGDASELVPAMQLLADALYLDGFSPDRDPALWSPALLRESVAKLRAGGRIATYSVAAPVRDALAQAGVALERRPGTGGKRACLSGARTAGDAAPAVADRSALVIGAGIAGCAIARGLCRRGWRVELLERAPRPAQGVSMQPLLAQHPSLTLDDNRSARLSRAAVFIARAGYDDAAMRWGGRLQLLEPDRIAALGASVAPQWARALDAADASAVAGVALRAGALWLPLTGWADPAALCGGWLDAAGGALRAHWATPVAALHGTGRGAWIARDAAGGDIASAAVAIVAAGEAAPALAATEAIALRRHWGAGIVASGAQVPPLRCVVGGDGFAAPLAHDAVAIVPPSPAGAVPAPSDPQVAWQRFAAMLVHPPAAPPSLTAGVGRWRVSPRDRLPAIGAVPAASGLYVACGFGGRGLLWAPLAAELIACALDGAPAPVEADLAAAVAPARLLPRAPARTRALPA